MAKQYPALEDVHVKFIAQQHMFFTGSAAPDGRVNVSPKGMDSLRVLGPNRILWRNLTGSGNETAGHLLRANRMTLMWCSFTTRPLILRAYGTARTIHADDAEFAALNDQFPANIGARQVYDMTVDLVQTSCGFAVPFMDYAGERDTLTRANESLGPDRIKAYWSEKNAKTLDGLPTR